MEEEEGHETMATRTLYLTPLSHFSRKVRVVLEEMRLECDFSYAPNLLSEDPADFGGNPILRVPVLKDGTNWVVESDNIVRYLLDTYDPGNDRFSFLHMTVPQRNALAFITAVMGAEVELTLSRRSGIRPGEGEAYFHRYREVIHNCLQWLETEGRSTWPDTEFSYLDIALICMWDHLQHGRLVELQGQYPWITNRTEGHSGRQSVRDTSPENQQELQWKLYPSQRPT